jgi:excisionase family DNA binding protein
MTELLTVPESAKRMNVSRVTIYQWIKKGLKTTKTFRGTKQTQLIDPKDLDVFVKEAING